MARRRVGICVSALVLGLATLAGAQQVTKIESGDTILVDGVGKVRLIGIRSVDESPFGVGQNRAAPARQDPPSPTSLPPSAVAGSLKLKPNRPSRDYLTTLLLGRTVKLQRDPLIGGKGGLAYVFLDDGTLVNAEMLRQGMARTDLSREFAHEEEFKRLEAEAHESGTGVWAISPRP
jgi:endonuclease YncB( thermonuclease family)